MKVLVTGGAGFIGGHLAERLVSDGHEVTVLDSLDPFYDVGIKTRAVEAARRAAGSSAAGSYSFVEGDVRDESLVQSSMTDVDVVYHQAGRAGVRSSVDDPRTYNDVNVGGTLNILDAAREVAAERVVIASSSSVYGVPEYLPYDEMHPTTPISPYGASKLAAERYGCAYDRVYDISVVALRYFTVYGPRMRPNMAISNFVSRCANGRNPVVYGDGTQTRDFTYIADVVEANLGLLDSGALDGQAVNIGSTDNISIRELADTVRRALDPSLSLSFDERHHADAEHTHADVSKARQHLGYEPSFTIEEGLSAFIEWYQQHDDWYEPLVLSS
jgi:UDP-glucose 4-epimerase